MNQARRRSVHAILPIVFAATAVSQSASTEPPDRMALTAALTDDPRRLGPAWDAYVADVRTQLDQLPPDAPDSLRTSVTLACLPEFTGTYASYGNVRWPFAIYDPRLLEPSQALLDHATDTRTRAMALASMAAAARAFDWTQAIALATEAHAAADSLHDRGIPDDDLMWMVIDFMESRLSDELSSHVGHLRNARTLYRVEHATDPPLDDPEALWDALRPYMTKVVDVSGPFLEDGSPPAENRPHKDRRDPTAVDLTSNRFLTAPGICVRYLDYTQFWTFRIRHGPIYYAMDQAIERSYPLDTPEHVLLNYAHAHRVRDIDLYASLFDRSFAGHVVDPNARPTTRDQEIAGTRGMFARAPTLSLTASFERGVPSSLARYPAADGYRVIRVLRGELRVGRDETTDIAADLTGMRFVLRRTPATGAWQIAAQLPPTNMPRPRRSTNGDVTFPVTITLGTNKYLYVTADPPMLYRSGHAIEVDYRDSVLTIEGQQVAPPPEQGPPKLIVLRRLYGNVDTVLERLPIEVAATPNDSTAAWMRAADYWYDLQHDVVFDVQREYFLNVTERGMTYREAALAAIELLRRNPLFVPESVEISEYSSEDAAMQTVFYEQRGRRHRTMVELRPTEPKRYVKPKRKETITLQEALNWVNRLDKLSVTSKYGDSHYYFETRGGGFYGRSAVLQALATVEAEDVMPASFRRTPWYETE